MRSRHVHTALTFEVTDSEAHLRRRTQALKEIHLDAVRREDIGYRLRKEPTVITAVVTNDNRYTTVLHVLKTAFFLDLEHIISVTLRCHRNDVLVHAVRTRTHDAAQTARTELEGAIESIDEFGLVLCLHHRLHLCTGLSVKRLFRPSLGYGHYLFQFFIHNGTILKLNYVVNYLSLRSSGKENRCTDTASRESP